VAISAAILAAGGIGELAGLGNLLVEDEGDFFLGKSFQRQQQEGLPRQRRDVRQPALRRRRRGRDFRLVVDRDRIPDLGKQPEKPGAGAVPLVQQRRILQQGLEHRSDIGVAGCLVAGQRAGIAPQQRQMFSNEL